jgi:hypothetical protein
MPAQDGIGGEKSADLSQELASQDFALDGQASALVVVEQDPFLADDLPEYLVLSSGGNRWPVGGPGWPSRRG